jgi:pimeloyl-ACP methyl ester carboxylesterase
MPSTISRRRRNSRRRSRWHPQLCQNCFAELQNFVEAFTRPADESSARTIRRMERAGVAEVSGSRTLPGGFVAWSEPDKTRGNTGPAGEATQSRRCKNEPIFETAAVRANVEFRVMAGNVPNPSDHKPRIRRRVLLGLVVAIVVAVALFANMLWVDSQTRAPAPRDGGTIIETGIEPANVKVEGQGPPILLLHGYGGAMDWWDDIAPALSVHHRVIRLDLIGHGGTAAPTSGYQIARQAELVSAVLDKLGVTRATVVGHSMGGWVATALASLNPKRIERLVLIDSPPTVDLHLSILAKAHVAPVLGEVLSHFVTDERLREGLADAFAPDFPIPERFVADLKRLPHCVFRQEHVEGFAYCEKPIYERLAELKPVPPVLSIFGSLDSKMSAEQAKLYERVPGAIVATIDGVGHSPQVEAPAKTGKLIEDFLVGEKPAKR